MRAYEGMGKKKAIIYSSILFGIFHLNLQNLIGPIFLGFILAKITYKTNSIYGSILGHSLSNTIAMTLGFWANKYLASVENSVVGYDIPYKTQMLITLIWFGVMALISSLALRKLLKNLPSNEVHIEGFKENIRFTDFIPVLLVFVLFIVVNVKYLFV